MTHSRIHRSAPCDGARFGGRSRWYPCAVLLFLLTLAAATVFAHTPAPTPATDTAAASPTPTATVPPDLPVHQMVWKQWTVSEGLPQITINDMLQDRQGYLWVAMQEGVARFDGLHFEHFTYAANPGLGHGFVTALGLDAEGVLWAGSLAGIARYSGGRWDAVRVDDWPNGVGQVLSLNPHSQGGMWVSSERGLFHATGMRARRIPIGLDGLRVMAVLPAVGTQPEVVVTHRHLVFDPLGARRLVTLADDIPDVMIAHRDEAGGLWLGTSAGLVHTDNQGRLQRLLVPGRMIKSLQPHYDGTLWVATDRGLWRIDPVAGAQLLDVPGLTEVEDVRKVFVDRERTLWVGTQLGGLYRAWPDRFRRITRRDGLVDEAVWAVYEAPGGEMWAGTPTGVFRGGVSGFRQVASEGDLPHPTVLGMLVDRHGGLWAGTYRGLAHRAPGATAWQEVDALKGYSVGALLEDLNGDVLIGSNAGLFVSRQGRTERVVLPMAEGGGGITALVHDAQGRIWLGHALGAFRREGERWVPVFSDREVNVMTMVPFGRDGMLLVGIDGLFHVGPGGARRIGRDQGVHHDMVTSVRVGDGYIWYQAVRGIGRIDIAQLQELLAGRRERLDVRVYGTLGDPHLAECNGGQQQAGALTAGRWLWCPSLKGLLVFDTWRADERVQPAPVVLQTLITPRRRLNLEHRSSRALTLAADERDVQVTFTGLSLRSPQRLEFRARLHGYDSEWQALGTQRVSYYTNLPPGDYTYELHAIDHEGQRGPSATLTFRIRPYWHETWWARGAGVLLLGLLVWLWVRRRLQALRRQGEQLEQRVIERTTELAQANEQLGQVNQQLEAASVTDPLTGLHNRRFLQQHLPHELARVDRALMEHEGDPERVLSVLHIDLDRFKQVNDSHGHHVGDQVLQAAADLLRANARASDFVLRWGGEEFLIVGRDTRRSELGAWTTRIVGQFREHSFATDAGPLHVTCSVGFAVYPPHPGGRDLAGWNHTMILADAATYVAKQEGRDRSIGVEWLQPEMAADLAQRLHTDLPALVERGWLKVLRP